MSETALTQTTQKNNREKPADRRRERPSSPANPLFADLLALQDTAGNQAVSELLKSRSANDKPGKNGLSADVQSLRGGSGQPLDDTTQSFMESRFRHDFSGVRIHTSPPAAASAKNLNARAYTVGEDIVFGAGHYQPHTPTGKSLLAHELAHVIQQQRGGSTPQLNPQAAHEQSAETAAAAAVNGSGPVTVSGATGVGVARAVEDWLIGTPGNIQDENQWRFSELVDEIDEIKEWLEYQIQFDEATIRMREVLAELEAELRRRQAPLFAKPKKSRRRQKRRKKRRKQPKPEELISTAETDPQKPRILRERANAEYADPEEINAEVDLIVAWLGREDVSPEDREILQVALQQLAPAFEQDRAVKATQRRSQKIQQALTPEVNTDARAQLVDAMRLVQSIQPLPERPGHSFLMRDQEMIVLTNEEADAIRQRVTKTLNDAYGRIKHTNDGAFTKWSHQAQVNSEESFAGFFVSLVTGEDAIGPFDQMSAFHGQAQTYLSRYIAQRRQGNFVGMARAIASAEENAVQARYIVDRWVDESIAAAGTIVEVLEFTRDAAATINAVLATIATGGAAAGAATFISAATPVATDLAQQASEVHLGLRDRIDWGRVGVNALVGLVTTKFGGALGNKLYARLAGNPAVASMGRKAFARVTSSLVTGRGAAAFQTTANAAYAVASGQDITVDQFLDQLAARLLDPKEMFLDVLMGEVGHRAAARQQRSSAAPPPKLLKPDRATKAEAGTPGAAQPEQPALEVIEGGGQTTPPRKPQLGVLEGGLSTGPSRPKRSSRTKKPPSEAAEQVKPAVEEAPLQATGTDGPVIDAPPPPPTASQPTGIATQPPTRAGGKGGTRSGGGGSRPPQTNGGGSKGRSSKGQRSKATGGKSSKGSQKGRQKRQEAKGSKRPPRPDVSSRFTDTHRETADRIYDTTSGELGVPGQVQTHRSGSAQRRASRGTGEDAGHRIGNRFGAPGGTGNLGRQNWRSNRHGTFKNLENQWAAQLKSGTKIHAEVTDVTRAGENRPFMRRAKWTETAPDGTVTQHEATFANTHTPRSRKAQGIAPTTTDSTNNIIDLAAERRKRGR